MQHDKSRPAGTTSKNPKNLTSPGADEPQNKQATTSGSTPATYRKDSSPRNERKSVSTSATPAADGQNDTSRQAGDGPASPACGLRSGVDVEITDEEFEEIMDILPEAGVDSGGYGRPAGS